MSIRPATLALATLAVLAATALSPSPRAAVAAPGWTWPVEGDVLTPYRNGDDPYAAGQHRGIDIGAAPGTPVGAAVAGTVRFAGVAGSSGLVVSVRTSDGALDTSYLHLSAIDVQEGDRLSAGERLGAVGTSGRRSAEASHLHFGVREAGTRHGYRDPLSYLPPPAPGHREPPPAPVPVAEPVPVPVPVSPAPLPAPDPVRVPSGRRVRLPGERRVRVPAARRLRLPAGRRAPGAAQAPAGAVAPQLAPLPALGAAGAPRGMAGDRHEVGPRAVAGLPGLPAPGLGPRPAPGPDRGPGPAEAGGAEQVDAGARAGPDLGWALACAGLLLAAALVGRPGGRGRPGSRGARPAAHAHARLRAIVKPLVGGR